MKPLAEDLRIHVIRPVLEALQMWSPVAENLLLGTAAAESGLGRRLVQQGGPARGIYQMEPATEAWLWESYIEPRAALALTIEQFRLPDLGDQTVGNLYFATAMARINYWRVPEELPEASDIEGLARYWKTHWNTGHGAGSPAKFILDYKELVK